MSIVGMFSQIEFFLASWICCVFGYISVGVNGVSPMSAHLVDIAFVRGGLSY